ncbi:MAG: hypothetical protein E7656_03050 [Ruminococcaceae bacterium]|nr:hypothetical protein [Oscillospiraceae bacterium]
MATKWKYATIPAAQRLSMLKSGNDELYKEEIARTKDAISNRLAAGLDVSEQMKWADTVSYNHNLSKAKGMGIDEASVSKDGYAQKLFGDMTESVGNKKISSQDKPLPIFDKKYYSDYKTMSRDDVAESVKNSYIRGINDRAALLSSKYNEYKNELDAEYDKKISDAFKAYRENEKLHEEALLNKGYSQKGGRSLTEKTAAREAVYDYVNGLRKEKNDLKQKARTELEASLYGLSENAMKNIADEYYRYNSLLANEQAEQYEQSRDAIADDKWWHELELEKAKLLKNEEARKDELLLQKEKEANDRELALKELAFKESASAADYEKWLAEFEAQKQYDNAKLYADIADKKEKNAIDRESLDLAREKFEKEKDQNNDASDPDDADGKSDKETESNAEKTNFGSGEYGDYYKTCLNVARRMAQLHRYDKELKTYVPTYSAQELLEWIRGFDLSVSEKKKICSYLGIRYVED